MSPFWERIWLRAMPGLFVVLWSTGFVGAKYGLPYAEPLTFLAIRFALVAVILAAAAVVFRMPWPRTGRLAGHAAVAGLLLHGVYLGGVFAAIAHGVEAGVAALIAGIQPLVVAALAGTVLKERVTGLQWFGLVLGLVGVTMVVWQKLTLGVGSATGFALAFLALLAIAAGTLYQKRFCQGMNLVTGNAIQFGVAAVAVYAAALGVETREVAWTGEFIFALLWLALVLSIGAISLLYLLIRRGEAARVSSLFFLVPAVTAVMAYAMFGETFGVVALVGMAVASVGVGFATYRPR